MNWSFFKELKDDPSKLFQQKVDNQVEKWYAKKIIGNLWKSFISCDSPSAGKMYGLVRAYKVENHVRIITSGYYLHNRIILGSCQYLQKNFYMKTLKEFHLELKTPATCQTLLTI